MRLFKANKLLVMYYWPTLFFYNT